VCSSTQQGKPEHASAQALNLGDRRLPELLAGLRTCPGGNRWAGLFDSRVLTLWTMLVNQADAGGNYIVTINVSTVADELGVHRNTVRRWLAFFAKHHLVELGRRYGGRGRGVTVRVVWIEHGVEHAERRQRAISYAKEKAQKREQDVLNYQTAQQRLTESFKQPAADGQPTHGGHIRTPTHARFVLFKLREAVNATALAKQQRETLMVQFSKWVWRKTLTLSQLRRVHGWLLDQAGKVIAFQGRALVQWLVRGLHNVVSWARSRSNTRATWRTVAELERDDRAAAAMTVDPAQVAAWRAEIRAALVADGWTMPATG